MTAITELENWLKLMDHDPGDSTPLEDAVKEAIEALKACDRAKHYTPSLDPPPPITPVQVVRQALKALMEACIKADSLEELSAEIDGSLIDDARMALELSDAPQPRQAWQPIETAPERRKVFVSWVNSLGKRRTTCAAFYPAGTLELDDAPEELLAEDGTNADAGWFECREAGDAVDWLLAEVLTHWMPLPDPPLPASSSTQKE